MDFSGSAKDIGCFLCLRTAGHSTAGIHDIPFQRYHLILMAIFLCQSDCLIQIFHNEDSSQQIGHDSAVFFRKGHQRICCANDAPFFQNGRTSFQPSAFHRCDRQEGSTTQTPLFQILDSVFGIFFCLGDNVLHGTAQCRFNGSFIGFFYLQKLPNSTADAPLFLIWQIQKAFDAVVKAFMLSLQFRQQSQTGFFLRNHSFLLCQRTFCLGFGF